MEIIKYGGWKRNAHITNGKIELVVTGEVGPRIIRLGFVGKRNLFYEMEKQIGGQGEKEWMIRGGHRLWIAPEKKPFTYEPDNAAVNIKSVSGGVKVEAPVGTLSKCQKTMIVKMDRKNNQVTIVHEIANRGKKTLLMAPWALSVMAPGGMSILPLPKAKSHSSDMLLPNQVWSLWPYTSLTDGRIKAGDKYVFFKQDRKKGPNKLGMLNQEGWAAYVLGPYLFVKTVEYSVGADYPDRGVNYETYSDEQILEMETLGPLTALKPGKSVRHTEKWFLFDNVSFIKNEKDADSQVYRRVLKALQFK